MGRAMPVPPKAQLLQGENKGSMQERGGQMGWPGRGHIHTKVPNLEEAHPHLRRMADMGKGAVYKEITHSAILLRVLCDL